MVKNCLVLVVLIIICAGSAVAETYTWVDDSGTTNFTEDLSQVPKKYRKKARKLGDMGPPAPESGSAPADVKAPKSADKAAPAVVGTAPEKTEKKEALYGNKTGASWKQEFAGIRAEIDATDGQISEMSARLGNTAGMSRTEYLSIQNTIRSLENHKVELNKKLDALNERATKAKVPAEFR